MSTTLAGPESDSESFHDLQDVFIKHAEAASWYTVRFAKAEHELGIDSDSLIDVYRVKNGELIKVHTSRSAL